jgi:hypothetical protein
MILDTVYALAIIFIVIPSILINFVMGLTLYKVREILNELRQEAVVAAAKVIRGERICANKLGMNYIRIGKTPFH